jgi:predicted acyltransferase
LGMPNLYMILCRNLTTASYVMFTTGIASIHLVNVFMVTNKNLNPPGALGKMPTMQFPTL